MSTDNKKVKKGLVTEMREVKHPFTTQGIQAQPGIEF